MMVIDNDEAYRRCDDSAEPMFEDVKWDDKSIRQMSEILASGYQLKNRSFRSYLRKDDSVHERHYTDQEIDELFLKVAPHYIVPGNPAL